MIVCLGWGSLIWNPECLPIKGEWHNDGPFLPVEFVRQSDDDRLTLVIDPESKPLQVFWAELDVCDLLGAAEQLRRREKTKHENIGRWPKGSGYKFSSEIEDWAKSKGIAGVVWTALGPSFSKSNGRRPSQEEAVEHLSNLIGIQRQLAQEYIEKAPQQIDTVYRRALKDVFS